MNQSPAVADPKARILIVDDEPLNRELLQLMLAPEGFDLVTACSGEEALEIVARKPPDLILLDVMMPGMDGFEVTTRLKADSATKNIAVVMVTALDDRDARMMGLSAGAEDFLGKPVDRAELTARVRNLLRLKAADAELAAALVEARNARTLAEHANAAKTMFLRSMSHELRTPLNAISGFAEILEMGIRGEVNAAQVSDLGRIKRAAGYLLRLINDILSVARLEGARSLNLIPIAVNPVLAEVEGLCGNQATVKGLTLTVAPCARETFVTADAERFQQILLNLITNAIKFTGKSGSVDVACHCAVNDTMVRISVKDTGTGVQVSDLDRVFEPFVQIDRHLTAASLQGVGLGLSISRDLARAMHGDLTLESTVGVGSVFTLVLPVASASVKERGTGYASGSLEPARISPSKD